MGDQLMRVVSEQLKRQFAISVTPEEVAQVSKTVLATHDPTLDTILWQRKWTAYNEAAHQIFDLQQDPEQVYHKLIAPLEQDQERGHKFWEATLVHWSTPEGRAQLAYIARSASMTQAIAKEVQWTLEKEKLNDALDSELAAGDARFRSYVEEWRKTATDVSPFERSSGLSFGRGTSSMPSDHLDYLNQKRHQFWMARYAEQQVTLNDPALANQCQLGSTLGKKVAGR